MAGSYTRRINLYINGKEVKNNINSIQGEMRKLIHEQRRMTVGSEEYNQQFKKIGRLKGILAKHQAEVRNMGKSWTTKAAERINKYFGLVASGVATVTGLAIAYKRAAEAAENFEERLDNLSALTGLEGQDLESLGRTAQEMSTKITDGGVRIKQSADDIVDAFTKVGSQRPELLKNKEALAAVTEDAILLSEAAKSDLEPAVKGLTTTMNQFNLPATESRRIINAMAAGSKEGAADIPYLTQAIEKSGTTMNLMNVSLEENIGLIEAIAPNYAKAEMAGNSLDKVFLKIKEKQIGYVDGNFNLSAALEELATRYAGGETAADLFGVEHAKMGELLVQNRGKVKEYTVAVTGTSVAIEQAAKNTNNAKAIQAQANNAFHNASVEIGKNLSPAMTGLYKIAGSVAQAFVRMIETSPAEALRKEQTELNLLVGSITNVNNSQETRNKFIEELQEKYPDFLGNLDTEKVTNEELRDRLKEVNEEYENKILLSIKEDSLKDNYKDRFELKLKELETIRKIAKKEIELAEMEAAQAKEAPGSARYNELAKNISTAETSLIAYGKRLDRNREKVSALVKEETELNEAISSLKTKPGNVDPDTTTKVGTKKTVGNTLYEWDGSNWEIVQQLTGAAENFDMNILDPAKDEEIDIGWVEAELMADAERFAAKKRSEEEWTAFLNQQIEERAAAAAKGLEIETEIAQAREELKNIQVAAIGQIASALSGMFEQGSAAQIAMIAIEKAIAIAQIWINLAKEKSLISVAAAQMATIPIIGPGLAASYSAAMTAKAITSAKINTALVLAQTIAQASGSKKSKKETKGYAAGGYTDGDRIYRAGEKGKEWIAPNRMVSDPFTGPIIQSLEALRNRRSYVNPLAIKAVESRNSTNYQGGSNASFVGPVSGGSPVQVEIDPKLSPAIEKLIRRLDEPIEARFNTFGQNSLDVEMKKIKRFNKLVYRNE